jgi:transcriptional regulator with XRE-family HTH domain
MEGKLSEDPMAAIDPSDFSVALVLLRKIRRWSQEELARRAGLPATTVCEYETGKVEPTDRNLERMMAAFRFPLPLLGGLLALVRAVRHVMTVCEAVGGILLPNSLDTVAAEAGRAAEEATRAAFSLTLAELAPAAAAPPAEEEHLAAPGLRARLEPYSQGERLLLVRAGRRFRSWALAVLLCDESISAAADDPRRAVDLADLALEIARLVLGGEGWRSRLLGYCWSFVGNARRVSGDLPAAEEAFGRSREAWPASLANEEGLLDGSRRFDLEASLQRSQRRFAEAIVLLDQALGACPAASAGRILVKKAKTQEEMGDHESAIATLQEALPHVAEADEHLLLAARFNLLVNLSRLGRHAEAEAMLPPVRALAERLGNGLDRVRLRSLEGQLAAGLGRVEEALASLREVRDRFVSLGIAYDAALATLELAVVLAQQGRTAEVKALAAESAPIFAAQGVERERLGALALFRQAADEERLTAALARRLLEDLRRAPALRGAGAHERNRE